MGIEIIHVADVREHWFATLDNPAPWATGEHIKLALNGRIGGLGGVDSRTSVGLACSEATIMLGQKFGAIVVGDR